MGPLDTSLFPGVSSGIQVHDGFRDAQAETAPQILAEVKRLMAAHNTQSVTCVCTLEAPVALSRLNIGIRLVIHWAVR